MGIQARTPSVVFALAVVGMGIVGCAPAARSNVISVGAWELTLRRDAVTGLVSSGWAVRGSSLPGFGWR